MDIGIIFTKDNLNSAQWKENCFKYCEFNDIELEGQHIDSDFIDCRFENFYCYWGIFNIVNFVGCRFTNCTFRGSCFPDCVFVECEFYNCRFIKDNLNSDCDFRDSRAYNCAVIESIGFNAKLLSKK